MTFTNAIAKHIEATFPNGETMTKYDFVGVAKEFGKPDRSITHVLREMGARGGLRIVGELKNSNGGGPTTKYARILGALLVPPADYRKFSRQEWQRETNEKAALASECAMRLHEVLDKMTRARMGEKPCAS